MRTTVTSWITAASLIALQSMTGCIAGDDGADPSPRNDGGTGYAIDYDALNDQWPGSTPVTTPQEAFSVRVDLGQMDLVAPTHLFGGEVVVVPYSNDDGVTDAHGAEFGRGDKVIAERFQPGEIGYAIKHHRPEYRDLALTDMGSGMKEHFKLQDTHIELVIGVERDGAPGAITLNNPQGYENGAFGSPHYPMIFVRPEFPDYVYADEAKAFRDNIRTMMLGFNAVSDFPGSYNGGDPLAAHSPERVVEHTAQMVRAIAGDEEARAWFRDDANLIYCAELAHVSTSAGILVPLNDDMMVPLVGEAIWAEFQDEVARHNAGEPSAFTALNDNERARYVEAALAPEWLAPLPEYAPAELRDDAMTRLAFQPMTAADIVQQFMRTHIPREVFGESLAPAQGMVLQAMKPALFESMGLDQLPEDDPRVVAASDLFDRIVAVVGTPHEDYASFQIALAPLMEEARLLTGPRDDTGTGLFVPPSLLHVIAQGKHPGGLIKLQYVGHGLHTSMVYLPADEDPADEDPADEDPADEDPVDEDPVDDEPLATWDGFEASGTVAHDEQWRTETPLVGAGQYLFLLEHDEVAPGGDADLYVRVGEAPTLEAYDCRPWLPGSAEECVVDLTEPAVIHVMVHGYGDDPAAFLLSGIQVD